jgi:periplasmic protein TonB
MKYTFIVLISIVSSLVCVAQKDISNDTSVKVHEVVEEMPLFPGGEQALLKYIARNIEYPTIAREKGVEGKVYVSFVIDEAGNVIDTKILRGIGSGCDEEAIRVVNSMPKWTPGKQDGKNVRVHYNLPINFHLGSRKEVKDFKRRINE